MSWLRSRDIFSMKEMRATFSTGPKDVQVEIDFSAAREALVREAKIDFRPVPPEGTLRRSTDHEKLRRSDRDRKAGLKKFTRSSDKLRAIDSEALPPLERDAIQRRKERATLLAATLTLAAQPKKARISLAAPIDIVAEPAPQEVEVPASLTAHPKE